MKKFATHTSSLLRHSFALSLALVPVTLTAAPEVGKPAPEFTLKDQDGKSHNLKDYKGKIVVLEWTSTKCPFVVDHYERKTMETTDNGFKGKEVVWLSIDSSSFTTPEASKTWVEKYGFDVPILQDAPGTVGVAYEAKTTPHMFVIDQAGTLRYDGAIDDDASDTKKVKTNYVTDAVTAVLAGKEPAVKSTKPYGCSVKYASSKG